MRAVDGAREAQTLARLDWRFLLSEPDPAAWGWLGGRSALRQAMDRFGPERVDGPLDLLVGSGLRTGQAAPALERLRPGGWLYLELGGSVWPPRALPPAPGLARRLRRAGFRDVALAWPWPDHERATRIMPLARRRPSIALDRLGDAPTHRLAGRAAGTLGSLGLLRAVAPAVAVTARRPGPRPLAAPGLAGALLDDPERYGLRGLRLPTHAADLDWLLLTPRFRSSRHVTLLAGPAGQPRLAAKMARAPGDDPSLVRTAEVLADLTRRAPAAAGATPCLLALDAWADRPLLVTSVVPGQPLSPARIRADRDRYARAVVEWLLRLPADEPAEGDEPAAAGEPLARLVGPALAQLEGPAAASTPLADLVARCREALAAESALRVGRRFEHGDLSHPNLLWADPGGLGVVDWELARPDGLPLHDLTLFLAYLAGAVDEATRPETIAAAFRRAVLAPDGWARPLLAEYATRAGLPRGALAPLAVAAWTRYLGSLPGRMFEPGMASSAEIGAWVMEHRYAHLLKASLDGWSSLQAIGREA